MTRSGGGPRSLGSLVPKLVGAAMGKRGFAEAGLASDWPAIVGGEIAAHCLPERLDFPRGERMDGTLHLRVEGAWALTLQHLEPQLIERINGSLGYRAVGRLKLHQGPLPERPKGKSGKSEAGHPAAEPLVVDPAERAALEAQVAAIEDPGLREAIGRLGLTLLAQGQGDKD